MGLLQLLVLCTLTACYVTLSPPAPVLSPSLLSRGCNDSDVLAFANFALQDINRDQKEGYVLRLNRVNDVWAQSQGDLGSLFYFTLDVLETDCHVLSKKAWKDCGARMFYDSVYGQCKALFFINKPKRVLYVPAYNCTLRPVSRRNIHHICPDCPRRSPVDSSDPNVLEAATESLAKYNRESPSKQYSLIKVTKASSYWAGSIGYSVEYLIKESPCTTSSDSSCSLQSSDSVPIALCKGSLSKTPFKKFVTATCDFFKSQVQAAEGQTSPVTQGPTSLPKVKGPQEENTSSPPKPAVPRGSVQHLPDLGDEKPEESEDKGPQEAFPVQLDLTTDPQGTTLDVSFLFIGPEEEKLVVLPFPGKEQRSAECPGPAGDANTLVLPP
uniref:Cystatin fetuin-B-type domain-containing protein n=1 Tax=Castor canadensis TaxID=51338 RepID=A0A8C0W9A7_CASCN|nr:fetuin-B-like isoform X1 [Castor canadensis]